MAYVTDGISSTNYSIDIDNQNVGNYSFDAIGNLTSDAAEDITDVEWNLQNKIQKIYKTNYSLFFDYDALGNRVQKFLNSTTPTDNEHTFYVRDAQGNVMSVYTYKIKPDYGNNPQLFWEEAHLYGSKRLGLYKPEIPIQNAPLTNNYLVNRGYKYYELTNHLGNVLATITDRKLPNTQSGITIYTADISTSQDYYPFGMLMPVRNSNAGNFRFGFNGKENDNEVKGVGDEQDYGMRIYDTRIGKFLSLDPLFKDYPWNSTYTFAENNPIQFIDLDGGEKKEPPKTRTETIIKITTEHKITVGAQLSGYSKQTAGFSIIPIRYTLFKWQTVIEKNLTTGKTTTTNFGDYPFNAKGTEIENSASIDIMGFGLKAKQTIKVDSDLEYIPGTSKWEGAISTPSIKNGEIKTNLKTKVEYNSGTGNTSVTQFSETSAGASALIGYDFSTKTEIIKKEVPLKQIEAKKDK